MRMFALLSDTIAAANVGADAIADLKVIYLDGDYQDMGGPRATVDMGNITVENELGRRCSNHDGIVEIASLAKDIITARKVAEIVKRAAKTLVDKHDDYGVTVIRYDCVGTAETYDADSEISISVARFAAIWVETLEV